MRFPQKRAKFSERAQVNGIKSYTKIVTTPDGGSGFQDAELALTDQIVAEGVPAFFVAGLGSGQVIFLRSDGFDSEPHPAPRKQWVLMLKGTIEVEVSDGSRRRFGPGDLILAADTTGRGHVTTAIGAPPFEGLFVPAPDQ